MWLNAHTLGSRRTKVCKKLRTRRKRLKTCYYSANNSLRRDSRRSESVTKFSTFQNFSKSWKKDVFDRRRKIAISRWKPNEIDQSFFYNILHLLINNSTRKIFEKFFFVFFKNLLNFSLFCNLLRLITFYGTNHFLWAKCQTIANRLENNVTERLCFFGRKMGFFL